MATISTSIAVLPIHAVGAKSSMNNGRFHMLKNCAGSLHARNALK